MPYEEIEALAASYPPQARGALLEFALERRKRQESEVLELTALASELSAESIIDAESRMNLGLESDIDPLLLKAVEASGSKFEPGSFSGLSAEEIDGHVRNIKGKYFEILTVDRLNRGETVGELKLLPDQEAILAPKQNTPGWDFKIVNQDGEVSEYIQNKATEDMSLIKGALEKYPEFRIATPAEIDGVADGIADKVIQSDIPHEALEAPTARAVEELGESGLASLLDQSAEFALDMVPILPAFMITVTEGRAVLTGSATLEISLQRGAKRLGHATAYNALGVGLSAVIGPAAMPTVMAVRIAERRFGHQMAMGDFLRSKTEEVVALTGQPA